MGWTSMNVMTSTLEMLGLCRASRFCRIARRYWSQRNLALFESKNLAADQLEKTMACNFPKRADKKSWTDRELRLEELEAVSGGTPAKHQQPHEYVNVQLKEVFIS